MCDRVEAFCSCFDSLGFGEADFNNQTPKVQLFTAFITNSPFIFIPCWLHWFLPVHWDQTMIIVCQSLGSRPILVLELFILVSRPFGQPPAVCPFSQFSWYLQEIFEDISLWFGLSPIDTVTPHGLLMLRNCFVDFAVEHGFGCRATEPGFAGDIDAIEVWLIDWSTQCTRVKPLKTQSRHQIVDWQKYGPISKTIKTFVDMFLSQTKTDKSNELFRPEPLLDRLQNDAGSLVCRILRHTYSTPDKLAAGETAACSALWDHPIYNTILSLSTIESTSTAALNFILHTAQGSYQDL